MKVNQIKANDSKVLVQSISYKRPYSAQEKYIVFLVRSIANISNTFVQILNLLYSNKNKACPLHYFDWQACTLYHLINLFFKNIICTLIVVECILELKLSCSKATFQFLLLFFELNDHQFN